MKRKGRKLVSIMIIPNIWDEIYLRVCFLGETVLVMIRRLSQQLQRLSLSLSVENQFQVMKKSREE